MNCYLCGSNAPPESSFCPGCGTSLKGSTSGGPSSVQTSLHYAPGSFAPGQPFGDRYTIVEEIGAGGMGRVYKAIDRKLRRTVALKIVPPEIARESVAIERFRRELSLAQQVTHTNVCRVYDMGVTTGVRFISMEYIDGQTLKDWVQAVGRFSPRQTIALARQICAGLQAVHERSIVHRDLKPANIMVDRSGHVAVMDFGLAYHPESDKVTAVGEVLGTLAYVAPEQARGQSADARSDVYSLGLILFEMLTGRRAPGDGGRVPLAFRDPHEVCPPPSRFAPEVPPSLDETVLRALERDPEKRWPSVAEIDERLAEIGSHLSATVPADQELPRRKKVPRRLVAVAAVVAAVAGAAMLVALLRPPALAFVPWTYSGPDESAHLAESLPLMLGDVLRANRGIRVSRVAYAQAAALPGDLGVDWALSAEVQLKGKTFEAELHLRGSRGEPAGWPKTFRRDIESALWLRETANRMADAVRDALGVPSGRAGQALKHYLEGRDYLEGWDVEKNYERAEQSFLKAIELDESFAEARAGLAQALWTRYNITREASAVDRALKEAQQAVALAPSLPEARLALGIVELGQGRTAEAKASFEEAERLAPADDLVCGRIARAYERLERHGEAEKMYQRAIELGPRSWGNYNAKGVFYWRRGRLEEARKLFEEVIRLRPESTVGYGNLAAAYISEGEMLEAEPFLTKSLHINPKQPDVRNNLGIVYYSTGKFAEAALEWSEVANARPEHPTPWGNLGDARRQLGETTRAREAYTHAIERGEANLRVNPSDARARAFLSTSLAGVGRCADAREQAFRAGFDAADEGAVHYHAAITYSICGSRDLAIQHIERAIKLGSVVDVRTNPDLKPLLNAPTVQGLLR